MPVTSKYFELLLYFQWPYCDGSHGAFNKETGDNVGPAVIKHKEKKWTIWLLFIDYLAI